MPANYYQGELYSPQTVRGESGGWGGGGGGVEVTAYLQRT